MSELLDPMHLKHTVTVPQYTIVNVLQNVLIVWKMGVAFHQPVFFRSLSNVSSLYYKSMDFSLLEKNIQKRLYGCTEAFLADVKWIMHNSCVFNGSQHPLSTNAKTIVKTCESDMQEVEVCPDCFMRSIVRNKYWFSEVCRKPLILSMG
ncbi:protein kinase C-binding protein 1 [Caerostris extrusa]|uniref:Protein kinase C-binding protein 1 n=1 Tax=Caerostris extrusa TaxID=172846 RepID=A0AAV4ULK2_CAEEX|nr:protein kinase C-binding protein 1 [Caerostris extrusa]